MTSIARVIRAGGIAAAHGPDDSTQVHYDDTIRTGAGLCDAAAVQRLVEEGPAAIDELPSRTLGTAGGGVWPVDPADPNGVASRTPVFQFDLLLGESPGFTRIGEREHVRIFHDPQPLAPRVVRKVRRLFLGRFRV